jgi:pimeloyl-ACP methyl ester carboxylesterase
MNYVFLHGGAQGGWIWNELIEAMRLQTGGVFGRALALDAPGCGAKRDRSQDGVTVESIAAELVDDIERSGCKEIIMVGHSQAGTEIPLMLKLRPDLFQRVVYVACAAPAPGKTLLNFREELFAPETLPHTDADIKALMRLFMANDMDDAEADAFMAKLGRDSWPSSTYAKTDWRYDDEPARHPVTYVLTLQDIGVPPPIQEIFARRLKADRIVRMDCGHQPMNSRPHALAELILRAARGAL